MPDKIDKERLSALKNEIRMAEKLNEEELEPLMREALDRYMGVHVPEFGADWDIILNEVYPIIQNNLPSIFFRNPRVFLKPRNKTFIGKKRNPVSGQMEEVQMDSTKSARTQEAILNYCMSEIKYKKETRKVLLDALLFPFGVLWHGYKGKFGMTEEKSIWIKNDKPFILRICPTRFLFDPSVTISTLDEAKWQARAIDIPLRDLVEDDLFDVDPRIVKGFKGFGNKVGTASMEAYAKGTGSKTGEDYVKMMGLRKSLIDYTDKNFQESPFAHFVRVYEVCLRPSKKEVREGKKGWILMLTEEQEKPLRVDDWVIKAEGFPGHILQFNELNDASFGLSDIEAYKQCADQKNVIVNLQLRNAQENSKVYVGISKEGANEEDVEAMVKGEQSVVRFESGNPNERMTVSSAGGAASSELYLIDQRIQKNLEDKSGVTDLKRGFLQSGEESAASVKIRAAGGGARPAYRQDIMADFLRDSCLYLNQINKQFMPYEEAVRIVGSFDLEWSENPSKEELQADVDAEIDVISMLPENPDKEIAELNAVLVLIFQAMANPAIMQKIQQEGKTFNISPLVEQLLMRMKLRDPEIFRSIHPEESQGFVSVQQIREAKENVTAAITGQQIPFPPKGGDDSLAKLEVYTTIQQLLQMAGQVSDALNQLILMHQALLQAEEEKQAKPGAEIKLKKPSEIKI